MEKIILEENLAKLVDKLADNYDVYAPVIKGDSSEFAIIKHLKDSNLEMTNTTKSIKELFLPQSEKLFSIAGTGANIEIKPEQPINKKRILLGVKSCDVKGLELLTSVYGQEPNKDELFLDKKNNTLIIGFSCLNPNDTCFCTALDVNPVEEKGMDIVLTQIDKKYYVKTLTSQGEELIYKNINLFDETSQNDTENKNKIIKSIPEQNQKIDIKKIKAKLDNNFDLPLWEELSLRCINCGICAYLCPTCQCFDIHDETGKDCTGRYRTWDTCMSCDFTRMAGGHNPRGSKISRVRQRFMHKFKYYPDHFNASDCTGCGRCIKFCPVNIDILELLKKLEKME